MKHILKMKKYVVRNCYKSVLIIPFTMVLSACSSIPYKGIRGYRDAGKKIDIIYLTPEEIMRQMGVDATNEVEKSLIPVGGKLILATKKETMGNPGGYQFDVSNQKQWVHYVNINIDQHYYSKCDNLMDVRPDRGWKSIFIDSKWTYQECEINKPIDAEFEVLVMNYQESPIGKYSVRLVSH